MTWRAATGRGRESNSWNGKGGSLVKDSRVDGNGKGGEGKGI